MNYYVYDVKINIVLFNTVGYCSMYICTEDKMSKEKNLAPEEREKIEKTVLITKEKENLVVCEVCGYANPEKTAICKMCSNYLKGVM